MGCGMRGGHESTTYPNITMFYLVAMATVWLDYTLDPVKSDGIMGLGGLWDNDLQSPHGHFRLSIISLNQIDNVLSAPHVHSKYRAMNLNDRITLHKKNNRKEKSKNKSKIQNPRSEKGKRKDKTVHQFVPWISEL